MIKLYALYTLMLASISSTVYPYLISTQVLKNPATGQTVVLYGDCHADADLDRKLTESAFQSSQILRRIYNAANHSSDNKESIKILIEGIDQKDIAGYFFKESPLIRLSLLKAYKFGVFNWTRKVTPPYISEQIINIDIRRPLKNKPYNSLREEIGGITNSLHKKLRDCDTQSSSDFINLYQNWIDFTEFRILTKLETLPQSEDLTKNLPLSNLLDINTVLEILSDQKTSKFIVVAGDLHVKKIILALEREGYVAQYKSETMIDTGIEASLKNDLEQYTNKKTYSSNELQSWKSFCDYLLKDQHYNIEFMAINTQDLNWIDNHLAPHLQINEQTDNHEKPIPLPKLKIYFKSGVIGFTALTGICAALTIKYLWGLL